MDPRHGQPSLFAGVSSFFPGPQEGTLPAFSMPKGLRLMARVLKLSPGPAILPCPGGPWSDQSGAFLEALLPPVTSSHPQTPVSCLLLKSLSQGLLLGEDGGFP